MATSVKITVDVIDNLIKAKDFRQDTINRFKSRNKIEPLGVRQA